MVCIYTYIHYNVLTITLKIFDGIISLHHGSPNNNSLYSALGERILILTDGQFQQSLVYQFEKLLHKKQDVSSLLESNQVQPYQLFFNTDVF